MSALPQLVFLVGFPRSGTTWLMHLLARHPAVVGCHQAGLFHALQPLSHWWHNAGGFGKELVVTDPDGGRQQLDLTETLRALSFEEVARGIAGRVFEGIAQARPGVRAIVEQTPENLEYQELILRLYPDAWFLHLVRDPRAVYCSWRKALRSWATYSHFVDSPAQVARRWCEFDVLGRKLEAATERYRLVRYEDLLRDTAPAVESLLSWIGLDVPDGHGQRAAESCGIDRLRREVKAPEGFFRRGSAEGWRDEIDSSALRILEFLAREAMTRHGYTLVTGGRRRPLGLWAYEQLARVARGVRFGVSEEVRRRLKGMSTW